MNEDRCSRSTKQRKELEMVVAETTALLETLERFFNVIVTFPLVLTDMEELRNIEAIWNDELNWQSQELVDLIVTIAELEDQIKTEYGEK